MSSDFNRCTQVKLNKARALVGQQLKEFLIEQYNNGDDRDDLVDALTDLLHHGALGAEDISEAASLAIEHYTIERTQAEKEQTT